MSVGYLGYAAIGSSYVLCTSADSTLTVEQIYSGGVWGAGWKNSLGAAYFAKGPVMYNGNVSFDYQDNGVIGDILEYGYLKRAEVGGTSVIISLEGSISYNYTDAYIGSFDMSTGQGSLLSGSMAILSTTRSTSVGHGTYPSYEGSGSLAATGKPIAFWQTSLTVESGISSDYIALDWNMSWNNNPITVNGCRGSINDSGRNPIAILMGIIDVSGSVTYWSKGSYINLSPAAADDNKITIVVPTKTIVLNKCVLESVAGNIRGQSDVSVQTYNWKAAGTMGSEIATLS